MDAETRRNVLDAVDGGLKLVTEDLLYLHSAVQRADGHLSMNALRTLMMELESIKRQADKLSTIAANSVRILSRREKFRSTTSTP